jgi:hypothetical protein
MIIHLQYRLILGQILREISVSNAGTIKNVQKMTQMETKKSADYVGSSRHELSRSTVEKWGRVG